jgi:bifunctional non-homologous end joining protein LigD
VERRAPGLATSKWWKEERQGVFIDYNQNAKDRTTASAYSVRAVPDARVSTPLEWDEVATCDPAAFTVKTVRDRLAAAGDPAAGIDAAAGLLDSLLELSDAQAASGMADAPWPPHYAKQAGEEPRVMPSRRRKEGPAPKKRPRENPAVITIAKAERKEDALAGLERWKARHPEVAAKLAPADVLVDSMRGRSMTWTRIRINLKDVPQEEWPPKEAPDPDYEFTWFKPRRP